MNVQQSPTRTGRRRWTTLGAAVAATLFAIPFVGQVAEAIGEPGADITVTITNKEYDGTTDAVATACQVTGDVSANPNVDCDISGATATFVNANVGTGKNVVVTGIVLTGDDAALWSVGTVTATANITAATLTVTPVNKSVTYGAAAPASTFYTYGITGYAEGDDVDNLTTAPTCGSTYSTSNVVADSPLTITCSGGAATNYVFDYTADADLTIDKATLTVTPDDQSVDYGDAAPASDFYTYDITGFVNGDDETDLTSLPTCDSDYVQGDAVADAPFTITCTGGAADNYDFNLDATANLGIDAVELTVTPDDQSVTYGDAAPASDFYTRTISGYVNGDDVDDLTTAPTCSSSYTQGDAVADGPLTITCSGGVADNYIFNYDAEAELTIDPATLTVTPDDQSVTYGDDAPDAAFYTFDVNGFISPDSASDASYVAPECGSDYAVGDGVSDSPMTITCTGGSMDNYVFEYETADLTIDPATLTVTPDDTNVTYGDDAPTTFDVTVDGWVNGESEATTGYVAPDCTTDYEAGDPAGSYDITCTDAEMPNYEFDYNVGTLTVDPLTVPVDAVWYTGPNEKYTASASDTLVKVTLSATLSLDLINEDGGETCADTAVSVADATVTFSDKMSGKIIAKGVPFSEVAGNCEEGIATTIATLSAGSYGTEIYVIVTTLGGSLEGNNNEAGGQIDTDLPTAQITISQPRVAGQLQGGGDLAVNLKTGTYDLGTSGSLTSGMGGDPATVSFRFAPGSRKVLPKGQTVVIIPAADGGLYYIKSNSITSVVVGTTVTSVYTKASITLVGGTCATSCAIEGGAILRLDVTNANNALVGYTVQSGKTSALLYSNHWYKSGKVWTTMTQLLS